MGKIKHLKYIHLDYAVLNADDLNDKEKYVLANIIGVVTNGGQYKFDNKFISDYLNCSTRTASRVVSSLKNKGIIESAHRYKPGTKEVQYRILHLTEIGVDRFVHTPTTELSYPHRQKWRSNTKL